MSIKKIAQMVGSSPATVSRILNDPSYRCRSEQLRKDVMLAAREINYVPNEAARSLKTGNLSKDQNVYYINVLMTFMGTADTDLFFHEIMQVVQHEIHRNSCILSQIWIKPIFSNDRGLEMENIPRMVDSLYADIEYKSDGLIIIGRCADKVMKELKQKCRNIISINREPTNTSEDEVICDGRKIAQMAVEHLVSLGHRDIAYVGASNENAKFIGFQDTLFKYHLKYNKEWTFETSQHEENGFRCMEKLMKMKERPTGIYCSNDIIAVGMLKYLNNNQNRYYFPSIISSDDIIEAQYTQPMLTTIRLPYDDMVSTAFTMLLDRINGRHKSIIRLELEAKLIIRESCTSADDSIQCEYYI